MTEWHRWFAWRPIVLSGSGVIRWLCFVERRQVRVPVYVFFCRYAITYREEWQYRTALSKRQNEQAAGLDRGPEEARQG